MDWHAKRNTVFFEMTEASSLSEKKKKTIENSVPALQKHSAPPLQRQADTIEISYFLFILRTV